MTRGVETTGFGGKVYLHSPVSGGSADDEVGIDAVALEL
jgi:hypothetical protein